MVIYPESFSVKPNTEATESFRNLFRTAAAMAARKNLTLPSGSYVFRSKNATEFRAVMSDCSAELPLGEPIDRHRAAVVMEGVSDMEIDCASSRFLTEGRMTALALLDCHRITIKNLTIETVRPDLHKFTVLKASPFTVNFKLDSVSTYETEGETCYFTGPDYRTAFTEGEADGSFLVTARPDNLSHLVRCEGHPFSGLASFRETAERVFTARFISPKDYVEGQVFYLYPPARAEVGVFLDSCSDVRFENLRVVCGGAHAFLAQNSADVTLIKPDFRPAQGSEIDFSTPGDFAHFSMCRGAIVIRDGSFNACGGDACSVHGFYYKIKSAIRSTVTVQFTGPLNACPGALHRGDTVAFLDRDSLCELGRATLLEVRRLDARGYELVLSSPGIPAGARLIENVSAAPRFDFTGNVLNRIGAHGLRLMTRGRVRVDNNRFLNTGASGVQIAGDADATCEGGSVTDVTIAGNAFVRCGASCVHVCPSVRSYAGPVHGGLTLNANLFMLAGTNALRVSCAAGVTMARNVYKGRAENNRIVFSRNTDGLVTDF